MKVIRTIIIVILVVAALYYAFVVQKANDRMDVLNSQDSLQTIDVNQFNHRVHDLELKFDGRGKHIRQFQARQDDFDDRLNETNRRLNSKVDSLGMVITALRARTDNQISTLQNKDEEIVESITTLKRKTHNDIMDLRTLLSRVNREIDKLDKQIKDLDEKKADKPEDEDKKDRR